MTFDGLDQDTFSSKLSAAYEDFRTNREESLDSLSKEKSVIVYSFGAKGKELSYQLRSAGIECTIFDNARQAVERASAEGFQTTSDIDLELPLIVAAGQNQWNILSTLTRPAYSLAEGLYAYDLIHAFGRAREFTTILPRVADELYQIYKQIGSSCRQEFLDVLLFRASLNVRHIVTSRKPVSEMYMPPPAISTIRSFCDVGAYDGDSLISMKAAFPDLESTFAVEPNPALVLRIEAAAKRSILENRIFVGAAWSHKTRLNCQLFRNGMMAITEDVSGSIEADTLDSITSLQHYDYVKFDVEGAEAPALQGAQSLLRDSRCIAIAGYHLPKDFVDIPKTLCEILGNESESEWRCDFHHYSECFDDSIFYFYRANG